MSEQNRSNVHTLSSRVVSWFVPPIAVPTLLALLIAAYLVLK